MNKKFKIAMWIAAIAGFIVLMVAVVKSPYAPRNIRHDLDALEKRVDGLHGRLESGHK